MTRHSNGDRSLSLLRRRPSGLLLVGLRSPILLYHARLGGLLGDRFLLLMHVGRKTGNKYQTVLEVVRHDRANDTWLVAAGWGGNTDWLRNVRQNPEVELMLGTRTAEFSAAVLPVERAAQELFDYGHRHPLAFREIAALYKGRAPAATMETCQALAREIPMVAFQPRTKG